VKAISLWQPWATLIALGIKRIETRGWSTRYRGPIAIHASKRFERDALDDIVWDLGDRGQWQSANRLSVVSDSGQIPRGALVAVARLAEVRTTDDLFGGDTLTPTEYVCGDFHPGRFGWLLEDVRALETPVPFRGAQGLFEVPDELVRA
jgi:hypothetical protein